jgi:hypothetical protein
MTITEFVFPLLVASPKSLLLTTTTTAKQHVEISFNHMLLFVNLNTCIHIRMTFVFLEILLLLHDYDDDNPPKPVFKL